MRQGDVRQAAREKAMEAQRQHRARMAERDRRVRHHAETVLVALGQRDAVVAETEHTAGVALLAMTNAEGLTLSDAVARCGGGHFTTREALILMRKARLSLAAAKPSVPAEPQVPAVPAEGPRR